MNVILWITLGGVVGWVIGRLLSLDRESAFIVMAMSMAGAFKGGIIFAQGDLLNLALTVRGIAPAVAGAILFPLIMRIAGHGSLR